MLFHQLPKKGVALAGASLLILTGCGKSTIDKQTVKEVKTTQTVQATTTMTVPVIIPPSPSESTSSPSAPSSTATPVPTTTTSSPPGPKSVGEFLALLKLDQSYAAYTKQLGGKDGSSAAFQIATNGQRVPEHTVPPGVVLDHAPDGSYYGSQTHPSMEWIDSQCGRVIRLQVGPEGGRFSGTTATYYWSGWANPPAAPEWCS